MNKDNEDRAGQACKADAEASAARMEDGGWRMEEFANLSKVAQRG